MRKKFKKIKPRIINHRSYNNFSNRYYRKCLFNEFKSENFANNDLGFKKFCDMNIKLLNKDAPIKMKYKRDNQMPFLTKDLSKAIMKISNLTNNYFKKTKLMQTELYTRSKETNACPF